MRLVIRESLSEFVGAAEAGDLNSRAAIIPLEMVLKVIGSTDALKCTTSHGINFSGIWPRELLASATDSDILTSVENE
jgi:hypothetical protein